MGFSFREWIMIMALPSLVVVLAIILLSNTSSSHQSLPNYHPSTVLDDASLSVPILSMLEHTMRFLRSYLNTSTIAIIEMNEVSLQSFGEDTYQQQTVFLRSYYSNEPIQAVHNELIHVFFLNVTSLQLSLINYATNKPLQLELHLAQSAENRYAPISLISPSHLLSSSLPTIEIKQVDKIRILSMNIFNYNYWLQRLPLLDEILHRYRPDIIGLQELRIRCKYLTSNLYPYEDAQLLHSFQIYDMMTLLSYFNNDNGEENRYQWYTAPAMFFKESTPEQHPPHIVGEGLGIISRFPIHKKHLLKLSRDPNDGLDFHQRLLLGVTVQINHDDESNEGHLLDVYTTHLSLSESARNRTLLEIGQYVQDELHTNSDQPRKLGAVIMGDFNCEFDYIEEEKHVLSQEPFNLKDVWQSKGLCTEPTKGNKYSYNFHHKSVKSNRVWNELETLFKTPNAEYLSEYVDIDADGDGNNPNGIKPIYDFDAWLKQLEASQAEKKEKDEEWWRDDRCQHGWTFNSYDMKKRIDYFFVNKELLRHVSDIQIVGGDVFETITDLAPVGGIKDMKDTLFASDHRFLYIDIDVNDV